MIVSFSRRGLLRISAALFTKIGTETPRLFELTLTTPLASMFLRISLAAVPSLELWKLVIRVAAELSASGFLTSIQRTSSPPEADPAMNVCSLMPVTLE